MKTGSSLWRLVKGARLTFALNGAE
jgi:hypothetical protein